MIKREKEEKPATRIPGPKSRRPVIPESFQISRTVSPMRQILDEAEGRVSAKDQVNEPQASKFSVGSIKTESPAESTSPVEIKSPAEFTGPTDSAGPVKIIGPAESTSPAKTPPLAHQI